MSIPLTAAFEELRRTVQHQEQKIISLEKMDALQEQKIGRISSDAESEKETRKRVNSEILAQLESVKGAIHKSDIFQAKMVGALLFLNAAVGVFALFKK